MWQRKLFGFILCIIIIKINAQQLLNRINGGTSGADNQFRRYNNHNVNEKRNDNNSDNNKNWQTNSWPSIMHNNWFILQATDTNNNEKSEYNQQQQQRQQQQQPEERTPITYYAYTDPYNQSNNTKNNGNYKQVRTSTSTTESDEPYVLAISKAIRHSDLRKQQQQQQYKLPTHSLLSSSSNLLSKDNRRQYVADAYASQKSIHQQEVKMPPVLSDNSIDTPHEIPKGSRHQQQSRVTAFKFYNTAENAAVAATAVDVAAAGVDDDVTVDDVHLNEFLVPFGNALDKVRNFCDIIKQVISDDDDDDVNDEGDENEDDLDEDGHNEVNFNDANTSSSTTTTNIKFVNEYNKSSALSTEVQGRTPAAGHTVSDALTWPASLLTSPPAWISTPRSVTAMSSLSSFQGNGRKLKKLKKKFKKLLLPLLIAYKLKFLTLIPVLIGGLTLLVGSTGLAGFFFALFTAVMSLKSSGGSKSIIIKKNLT